MAKPQAQPVSEPLLDPGPVDDPWARRWLRRAFSISLVGVAALVSLALCALVPLIALSDLLRRTRLASTRAFLAVSTVVWCELGGLVLAGLLWILGGVAGRTRFVAWNRSLQAAWARTLFWVLCRLYGLRVVVEGGEQLADTRRGLIVLSRHVSLTDTLLPMVLGAPRGWRFRYVLKRELLWDPCLDVVGQRLPNAFVRRGSTTPEREAARVARLGADLGPGDAVVIYPEGTRFSPEQRERVLAALARKGPPERLERAQRLQQVLPPRMGGAEALFAAAPDADLLVLAHRGLEGARRLSGFWRGALIGAEVRLHLRRIPAAEVPNEPTARAELVWQAWETMDAWLRAAATSPAERART